MVSEYSWPSIFIDFVKMIVSRKYKITAIDPINTMLLNIALHFADQLNNKIHEYWYYANIDETTVGQAILCKIRLMWKASVLDLPWVY